MTKRSISSLTRRADAIEAELARRGETPRSVDEVQAERMVAGNQRDRFRTEPTASSHDSFQARQLRRRSS